jgi:hypothetical protein
MKLQHPWRYRRGFNFGASTGNSGSNKAAQKGLQYHRRTYKALEAAYPDTSQLLIEPWFQEITGALRERMCSPDAVLLMPELEAALVIEVKLNWNDGKDNKLLDLYLPVVQSAFKLQTVWPVLITANLRQASQKPLLGLPALEDALSWVPGSPAPILLHP